MSLGTSQNLSAMGLNQSIESSFHKFEEITLQKGYEESRYLLEKMISFFKNNFASMDANKYSF